MSDSVTFVGHATIRLDLGGTSLLTDPLLRERFLHVFRHVPPAGPQSVAGVDAVLISHLHPDHLDFSSLKQVGTETEVVIPAGGGKLVRRRGFERVTELRPGESTRVGDVEVVATKAVHDGRRFDVGPAVEALGFDIRSPSHRIYFAGDTELFDEMADLRGADLALLPIGGWGPQLGHGKGHLDPRGAARAAAMMQPRVVVPIHWGTYLRLGLAKRIPHLEGLPDQLVGALADLAPGVKAQVLQPGESLALDWESISLE